MEVTRTNFQEVLVELEDVLEKATFLGVDGEFTGLNSGPDAGAFDTPAQYYSKLRAGSMDFLLVQFGLSIFTYNNETQKYNQQSYNFYVFPRPLNRTAPDCRFMCQASCISFLASQGFDFNKLFNLGIPYLTVTEEEKLVKRMEERQKAREDVPDLVPISDDDKPQIEEICSRINEFIESDAKEITIEKCSAFMRRLVHQEARMRWPGKLRVESKSDCTGHCIVVQRSGTKEEEKQKDIERKAKERLEIKNAVGLSVLLRMIADSGKMIVGHNMLLDLCHMVHQFFGPLPESYKEFKSLVHNLFPRILDTKIMCHSQQFREIVPSSDLNIVLETVRKTPFSIPEIECVEGRGYSTLDAKSHEAGYDAYITGLCVIALSNYLGTLQTPTVDTVLPDSPLLNPFVNKLMIARLKDIPYINLVSNDPNPSRDHVFHLTFPKEWKHNDITQLFRPFGGVYVSWLSDTSAYVGLYRRENATNVIKKLTGTGSYRIQRYVEHQMSVETAGVVGDRKRKLSSSENAAGKEDSGSATNGLKTSQDEEGWALATGNDFKLTKTYLPSSYPQPLTGAPRTLGIQREILDSLLEPGRPRSVKAPITLPTNLFNSNRKNFLPQYTILSRDSEHGSNTLEAANPSKQASTKSVGSPRRNSPADYTRSKKCVETEELHKSESGGSANASTTNAERGARSSGMLSKQKSSDSPPKVPASPKKVNKPPTSSPSASPRAKRNLRKQSKNKSSFNSYLEIEEKESRAECGPKSNNVSGGNDEISKLERADPLKGDKFFREESNLQMEEVRLKKSLIEEISLKKQAQSSALSGGMVVRLAQIVGVLFFIYAIIF